MKKYLLAIIISKSLILATALDNASNPLTTPTYDGSGQAVHPDIVYFSNSWHDWHYWLTFTPIFFITTNLANSGFSE